MRRIMIRAGIGVLVVGIVASLAVWQSPRAQIKMHALFDSWIEKLNAFGASSTASHEPPAPDKVTEVEQTTRDDGWCHYVGTKAPKDCPPSLPDVLLVSKEIASRIGLETARAEARTISSAVSGNAEITYATHNTAEIRPRVSGRIAKVYSDEGDRVKKGQLLLEVDSAQVGTSKAHYLSLLPIVDLARLDAARAANLRRTGAASEKEELTTRAEVNRVEAELLNARQMLLNLGQTDADLAGLSKTRDTSSLLKILAPQDGTLVERHAVQGEAVEANTQLFILTDLAHVWCWIDIYESDVVKVKHGQDVRFTIAGTDGPLFSGFVELVGFAVSPVTRTIRVRAELENQDGRLLANQFGRARIRVGAERNTVVVPRDAIQSENGQEFAFLPQSDGMRFITQRVVTQPSDDSKLVEVSWGLKPGDVVVTTGSFLLKTEVFKSSLATEE